MCCVIRYQHLGIRYCPVRRVQHYTGDRTGPRSLTGRNSCQQKHYRERREQPASQQSGLHTLVSEMSLQNLDLH